MSKKIIISMIIIICSFFFSSCAQKSRINPKGLNIDTIKLSYDSNSKDITDKSKVNSLIKILDDIKYRQLAVEEEERLVKEGIHNYSVTILSDKEIVGVVMVINEDTLVVFDGESMLSNNRTRSYINEVSESDKVDEVISQLKNF